MLIIKLQKYNIGRYKIMCKMIKAVLSLFLTICLLCEVNLMSFAYESQAFEIKDLVVTRMDGNKKIRELSKQGMDRIKKSRKFSKENDVIENVFLAFDIDYKEEYLKSLEDINLSHIDSIKSETCYLKVDEFGNQEIVAEADALKNAGAIEATNYNVSTMPRSGATNSHITDPPEISPDGYMKQTIALLYTPNYGGTNASVGRYVVLGLCEWLTTPSTRAVDAIALLSEDLRWANTGDDLYNLIVTYSENKYTVSTNTLTSTEVTKTFDESDVTISVSYGAYFEYDLPGNKLLTTYTDFSFFMTAVGRVHDYNNYDVQLAVGLEYVHLKNALSINPSFSFAGGLDLSVSSINIPDYYSCSYSWDYEEDYFA
jgi:hypothetical protein